MEASWCVTLSDQPCSYMQQKFSFAVICHNFWVFLVQNLSTSVLVIRLPVPL